MYLLVGNPIDKQTQKPRQGAPAEFVDESRQHPQMRVGIWKASQRQWQWCSQHSYQEKTEPGVSGYACSASHLGGRDQEDWQFEASSGK
jgi:hypothetical protein